MTAPNRMIPFLNPWRPHEKVHHPANRSTQHPGRRCRRADAAGHPGRRAAEIHHHRHRRRHRRVLRRRRRDLPPDEQGPRQARHPLLGRIHRRLGVQHQHHPRRRARLRRRPVRLAVPRRQRHARSFEKDGTFTDLRAVFSVHPEPFTVLARKEANIKKFEDFKGKRFNVGNPGSGTRASMDELLVAMGWTTQRLLAGLRAEGRRAWRRAVRQQDRRLLLRRRPPVGQHPGPDHDLRRQAGAADRPGGRQAGQAAPVLRQGQHPRRPVRRQPEPDADLRRAGDLRHLVQGARRRRSTNW